MKISFVCSRIPVWKYLKVFLLSACLWMKVSVCEGMVPTSVIEDWKVEAALAVPDDSSDRPDSFQSDFVVLPLALSVPEMPVRRLPGSGRNAHSRDMLRSFERHTVFCGRRDKCSFCLFINVISRMYSRSCDYYVFGHQRLLN